MVAALAAAGMAAEAAACEVAEPEPAAVAGMAAGAVAVCTGAALLPAVALRAEPEECAGANNLTKFLAFSDWLSAKNRMLTGLFKS